MITRSFPVLAMLLSAVGCSHVQLRNHTLRQASTIADLQYQQVLDNLAMFVVNPDSLPFFAVPSAGGTNINNTGQIGNTTVWNAFGFLQNSLAPTASQLRGGSWTLGPISDPGKLQRMRCAYQIAVGYYTGDDPTECRQCCELINRWYGVGNCGVPCHVPPPGWYGRGCKRDVPECACYVGHYCDTYVWVLPGGVEELTRLTLTILDFATAVSGFQGQESPKQQVVRHWEPIPAKDGTSGQEYRLTEVITTSNEPKTIEGKPEPLADARARQSLQMDAAGQPASTLDFDRPRENYFNPVLPQLQLIPNR